MSKLINKFKKKVVVLASVMLVLQPLLGLAVLPANTLAADPCIGLNSDVVINEVYVDATAANDNDSEFIELYNNSASSCVDISGWKIQTDGGGVADATLPASTKISAQGYYLIADNGWAASRDNMSWPLADNDEYELDLNNSDAGIALVDDSAEPVVIDAVGYGTPAEIWGGFEGTTPMANADVVNPNSIARIPAGTDTDENSDDFFPGTPTPKSSDIVAPVVTGVEDEKYYSDSVTPVFTEGTGTLSQDGGPADPFTSGTSVTSEGSYVLTVTDAAGNATTVNFVIDTTKPAFTSTVTPKIAGPGVKTVDITITTNEPLKSQVGPEGAYELMLVINEPGGTLTTVYLNHDISDPTGKTFTYAYTIQTAGKKHVSMNVGGTNLAGLGNFGSAVDGFDIDNIVLSPVVTTPTTSVVTAVATVPVDEQFGGGSSSDQGEVKADTTIKTDDGSKTDDSNQQKDDVKGKKNIPLWGIIFLLILAGIGGYLFYSQNPDKPSGRSNGKK
ncbi:MAG: lamin tail domain-containing protein [bacterium]|nr:lamin tail domain-containing protein [bacterium]